MYHSFTNEFEECNSIWKKENLRNENTDNKDNKDNEIDVSINDQIRSTLDFQIVTECDTLDLSSEKKDTNETLCLSTSNIDISLLHYVL